MNTDQVYSTKNNLSSNKNYQGSMQPCDYSTFKPHSNQQPNNSFIDQIDNQFPVNQKNFKSANDSSNFYDELNRVVLKNKSPPPKPPQRFSQLSSFNQNENFVTSIARSKSFACGLKNNLDVSFKESKPVINLRQAPITYAKSTAAVAANNQILNNSSNTSNLMKSEDKSINKKSSNTDLNFNQAFCQNYQNNFERNNNSTKQYSGGNLTKVNNEISQRYLAAIEKPISSMRHSQSYHSYLTTKEPESNTSLLSGGTLPNSISFHGQPIKTKNQGSLDASSLSSMGSSGSGSLTRGSTLFLQKYASLSNLNQPRKFFGGLSLSSKNNRVPQPQRSLLIFASIEKGLRECIGLTQEDISELKNAIGNGILLSPAQQYKNAERYLKRLEFQLAKIEELRDQYEMHLKMSEGVKSMTCAYVFSSGKEKENALSSVRNELKEYVQTMGLIETELEQSMGTFLLQLQGIQGFARLCAGDVFEISIKCGEKQKWKCKGKILKDNIQSWDSTEQIFRPNLTEKLTIKAVELRGLGKKLCLGSKNCEIKDLFSARPQLMSVCLNTTGTLKLHLIVTWNPLHDPKTGLNGFLSKSIQGMTLNSGTTLTKSKSFTSSSSSLFSRFKSGNTHLSTLNLGNHSYGQSFIGNQFDNTLNKRSTLPSGFEIIDADYYHHPHLLAEANKLDQINKRLTVHGNIPTNVKRVNSMLNNQTQNGYTQENKIIAFKNNNRHSYAGFNYTSLSPIHSPCLKTDNNEDAEESEIVSKNEKSFNQKNNLDSNILTTKTDGVTPTSTGSRGSSLHLTGTTSSGFGSSGSSSSYCSSVPNSTLTSPDSESAPSNSEKQGKKIKDYSNNSSPSQCDISKCDHCNHENKVEKTKDLVNSDNKKTEISNQSNPISTNLNNYITVEATVHQNPEKQFLGEKINENKQSVELKNKNSQNSVKITSVSLSEEKTNNKIENLNEENSSSTFIERTESLDTLTTPNEFYEKTYFNVGDTLINFMSALEDIQGQFSELHCLQENVLSLYKVLCQISKLKFIDNNLQNLNSNKLSSLNSIKTLNSDKKVLKRRGSDASNISVSIESALECFDFLNQVAGTDSEVDSVVCTPEKKINNKKEKSLSGSNKKNNLSSPEINNTNNVLISPPITPNHYAQSLNQLSTGCEQIDIALMSHLIYCQRLIENLGSFGPLRSREQSSLVKLQMQAEAIDKLIRVCIHLRDYLQVCIELRKDSQLNQYPIDLALELEKLHVQFKQQQDLELTSCYFNDPRIGKLWDFVCYMHTAEHEDEMIAAHFAKIDIGNSNKQNIALGKTLLCVTSAGFALCLEKFTQMNNLIPNHSMNNSLVSSLGQLSISMSNLTGIGNSSINNYSSPTNNYSASTNNKLNKSTLTTKISELVTKRVIDAPFFETDFVVSLFQLSIFLKNENSSLDHLFKSYAQEVQLLHSIQSNDAIEIENALNKFKKTLPPKEPLLNISQLLLDSDPMIVRIAESYFLNAAKNRSMRTAILNQFLDALQNDSAVLRQSACLAMMLLDCNEYLHHLVFISSVDSDPNVRNQAKQTLLASGPEGRKLYQDSQRFNNGFQGLTVN